MNLNLQHNKINKYYIYIYYICIYAYIGLSSPPNFKIVGFKTVVFLCCRLADLVRLWFLLLTFLVELSCKDTVDLEDNGLGQSLDTIEIGTVSTFGFSLTVGVCPWCIGELLGIAGGDKLSSFLLSVCNE